MTDYKVSSRSELFLKVAVLKISVTFTGKHLYQILFLNSIIGCRLQTYRSSHSQMFFEIDMFSRILQNSQENTCVGVSILIKLQAPPATILKQRLRRRYFPVIFLETFKNNFLQNTSA